MKKYFVTGLIMILPLAVTILILAYLIDFLTQPFVSVFSSILVYYNIVGENSPHLVVYLSKILILSSLFGITLSLGFFGYWFFEQYMIAFSNLIFHRIPLVSKVYKASQDIVKTVFTPKSDSFKQVIMVPFPNAKSRSLGLVSRETMPEGSSEEIQNYVTVLLPGTPNPTMGFVLLYKGGHIETLTMKPDEALKCVVSCGIILPEFGPATITKPEN